MNTIDNNKNKIKYQNYFSENGSAVKKIVNNNFRLKKLKNSTCYNCENENDEITNYCKFCGINLSKIREDAKVRGENKDLINIKDIFHIVNISKILKTSLLAILMLYIISWMFKGIISSLFGEILYSINPISIIMALNLAYVDISLSSMFESGYVNVHIGLIVLLIVPIVTLMVSNLLFMKKENTNLKSTILNSLGVGISYAFILSILSIVTKIRFNPYDMMSYDMAFSASYRLSSVFINSFIVGFLSTYIIGYKKSYNKDNIYLSMAKKSINIILLGYTLVFLLLLVITLSDSSYLYEFGMYTHINDFNIVLVITQLAAYIWGFANIIPVTISNYTISIFNLLGSDLFFNTKLIFIAMITLSSLILLVNGCNLKRKYKDNIKSVLIFSLFYALIMGILAMFSSIIIGGNISLLQSNNYQGNVILGLPVIITIIRSFIYSFIVTSIGYKLYAFEEPSIESI